MIFIVVLLHFLKNFDCIQIVENRCYCYCSPSKNNFSFYFNQEIMNSVDCVCQNVLNKSLHDLCDACVCNFETRNILVIKVLQIVYF
ncbi:hypothetical protein MXB_935 [Myxobolus squamalis]|nr:hypothetical protein MXB_935 [Myxobolus squamalis]